jgi:DNA-directed RNA polymerase subunit beta'
MVTLTIRAEPIEIRYKSFGNFSKIYEHSQIRRNRNCRILSIYVCTTAGRTLFNQQISEAIQGTYEAALKRERYFYTKYQNNHFLLEKIGGAVVEKPTT